MIFLQSTIKHQPLYRHHRKHITGPIQKYNPKIHISINKLPKSILQKQLIHKLTTIQILLTYISLIFLNIYLSPTLTSQHNKLSTQTKNPLPKNVHTNSHNQLSNNDADTSNKLNGTTTIQHSKSNTNTH